MLATSKHSKLNITAVLGDPLFGNCGGKGTGVVGGQTVGSMGCVANQWNVVCQSNYAFGWIFRRWLRKNIRN